MKNRVMIFIFLQLLLMRGINAKPAACFQGHPLYHFAPLQNWANDPNGLIYFRGQYHLFYQHNPFGNVWGHMSWGHAVSGDLLHWSHLPLAIPEDSVMIFSGSAVYDSLNTSGLGGAEGALVAIYTGHQDGRQAQHIAFSIDGGVTWKKYAGNPVLDRGMADFRDPKVVWYAPDKKWVMAVALPKLYKVALYSSANLLDWSLMSEFGPEGLAEGLWECPDLFEIAVEESSERKWVLVVSSTGPHLGHNGNQYFVGRFDGHTFVNDNPPQTTLFLDYGKDFYAGQSYNGTALNRRIIVAWMSNWLYAGNTPEQGFRGRMTLPRMLMLERTPRGLQLLQKPAIDLASVPPLLSLKESSADSINQCLSRLQPENAFCLNVEPNASMSLAIDGAYPFFSINSDCSMIIIDRDQELNCFADSRYATVDSIRMEEIGGFTLFFDSNSLEVFCNDGQQTLTYLLFPGVILNRLKFGGDAGFKSVEVKSLEPIRKP